MRSAGILLFASVLALVGCVDPAVQNVQTIPGLPPTQTFDIPKLSGITVDGDNQDWGDRGMRIPILVPADSSPQDPANYDVQVRLGWTDKGLLVLATVRDNIWLEAAHAENAYECDSLELFLADHVGATDVGQWVISPGMAADQPNVRTHFNDERKSPSRKGTPDGAIVARKKVGGACVIEALLPWSSVGCQPAPGKKVGFQIFAGDQDTEGGDRIAAVWYPVHRNPQRNSRLMHSLRLSERESVPAPAQAVQASASLDNGRTQVNVTVAGRDIHAKRVSISLDGKMVGDAAWPADASSLAFVNIGMPLPPPGKENVPADILIDGRKAATVDLSAMAKRRAEGILFESVRGYPSAVFLETKLPDVDFSNVLRAQQLIGPYEKQITYYDAAYNVVKSAEKPGRYGAVMTVRTSDGKTFRRFATLYRAPEAFQWWRTEVHSSVNFHKNLKIDPVVLQAAQEELEDCFKWRALEHLDDDTAPAVLLAGLVDNHDAKMNFYSNCAQQDRRWWLGLKRKLYGQDREFTRPVALPGAASQPATVIHEGTLKEAGMTPEGIARIDELCKEWAANSDQAFNVCIVRHGVIALHKAYGKRDGKDLTVDDKSWMASISKFICGVTLLEVLDQGQIKLADRADKFLSPLRNVATNEPLTVKHLFTHTSGFDWHWGDEEGDMEERIALVMPHIAVGQEWSYNGTGFALGGKIIEAVSGQTLPDFYHDHLFAPLGCTSIELGDGSHGARSTPLDMARIGQLVLNRGSYGDKRFFSPERINDFLPSPVGKLAANTPDTRYGLGCVDYDKEPLGPHTYGHGSAAAATLRICFDKDLIVVMCRNNAGPNFDKYHPLFLKAVAEAVAKE